MGTLGLSFNNFSIKRVFKKNAWRPFPLGDGQQLAIRFQTNGSYYTALTASFTEPWLLGNKQLHLMSLLITQDKQIPTISIKTPIKVWRYWCLNRIGTRLKWPDNWFVLYNEISAQNI